MSAALDPQRTLRANACRALTLAAGLWLLPAPGLGQVLTTDKPQYYLDDTIRVSYTHSCEPGSHRVVVEQLPHPEMSRSSWDSSLGKDDCASWPHRSGSMEIPIPGYAEPLKRGEAFGRMHLALEFEP